MINTQDVLETIQMIREENLDIRTITMGISLWDCVSEDTWQARRRASIWTRLRGWARRSSGRRI